MFAQTYLDDLSDKADKLGLRLYTRLTNDDDDDDFILFDGGKILVNGDTAEDCEEIFDEYEQKREQKLALLRTRASALGVEIADTGRVFVVIDENNNVITSQVYLNGVESFLDSYKKQG